MPENQTTKRVAKYAPFLVFVLCAAIFATVFWQGYDPHFDDATYLTYGRQILNGTFNVIQSSSAYGTAFLGTVALGLWLAHGAAWGSSLIQVMEYILIISITYLCLLKYFSRDVAFITALGFEISAFGAMYITRILPDFLLGLLVALVFLILAYKPKEKKYLFLAGLISGLMIFVKFGGFVLLILLGLGSLGLLWPIGIAILIGILLLLKQYNRLIFALGLFLGLVIYQLLLPTGLSLIKMANTYDMVQSQLSLATINTNLHAAQINFIGYFPPYFKQIFTLGAVAILAWVGLFLIMAKKQKALYFAAIAFCLSIGYMYLGSESLTHYVFITVVSRYFIEFIAPMALLAGVTVSYIFSKTRQTTLTRIILISGLLFIIAISNIVPYLIFYK